MLFLQRNIPRVERLVRMRGTMHLWRDQFTAALASVELCNLGPPNSVHCQDVWLVSRYLSSISPCELPKHWSLGIFFRLKAVNFTAIWVQSTFVLCNTWPSQPNYDKWVMCRDWGTFPHRDHLQLRPSRYAGNTTTVTTTTSRTKHSLDGDGHFVHLETTQTLHNAIAMQPLIYFFARFSNKYSASVVTWCQESHAVLTDNWISLVKFCTEHPSVETRLWFYRKMRFCSATWTVCVFSVPQMRNVRFTAQLRMSSSELIYVFILINLSQKKRNIFPGKWFALEEETWERLYKYFILLPLRVL